MIFQIISVDFNLGRTSRMPTRFMHLKKETTDQLLAKVHSLRAAQELGVFEEFTKRFYANVPPEDYSKASLDQLYSNVNAMWVMSSKRKKGEPLMEIFNPTIDDHGWESEHTIIQIVNDDMPFLVDSVTAALNKFGLTVHLIIHPVMHLIKNQKNEITQILKSADADKNAISESYMIFEVDEVIDAKILGKLRDVILAVLKDVRLSVEDWSTTRQKLADVIVISEKQKPKFITAAQFDETKAFIKWLDDNNFTFLGYRKYDLTTKDHQTSIQICPGEGLGVLRNDDVVLFNGLRNLKVLPADIQAFIDEPSYIMLTKTNAVSKVHRPVKMDALFIKSFDKDGKVVAEHLFVGLFTSTAYNKSIKEIPYFRQKLRSVMELSEFPPHSHSGKALVHILETYPRDEFFQITVDELYNISMGILHLQERQKIAIFCRKDPFERFMSILVYVPKDKYDTNIRIKTQKILADYFNGEIASYAVTMSEGIHAQLHVVINTIPGKIPAYDVAEIEQSLILGIKTWADDFLNAILQSYGERQGKHYRMLFAEAFSQAYQEFYSPKTAVLDIKRIESVIETKDLAINLYRPFEAPDNEVHFKIYHYKTPLTLSDVLPKLENMGLKVITERLFEVKCKSSDDSVWIHDFKSMTTEAEDVDMLEIRDLFQESFALIWSGKNEDDALNKLTLTAGLDWTQIKIFRTYAKYLKQAGMVYTLDLIATTLSKHSKITKALMELFFVKFDPAFEWEREDRINELNALIAKELDAVESIDEDKIIKAYANLIDSTLRTNFFQKEENGDHKSYLSIKINSQNVHDLPLPRPMVEIFVCSPDVEAIHLRGGKVARGGIRWSDRPLDFRTEVLGLMKAQMVKNTVIVPMGSKGGFVVKHQLPASAGRDAIQAQVIECYKTLMRGLLDLTDNVIDGKIIPPRDVVRFDEDDPYLVVAADKGTATFSDIANGVSIEYGFWLGDAFASGGSAGYDHKKMGITAKGAWESVKRHFREVGKDIQKEQFTCIGVGDMSGDVFGNGLLLSQKTLLLAAFNHMHIFCDPNPDPAVSFAERQRLFNLPRSTWADYDAKCLSKGAQIYSRSSKSLTLTPEIKKRFGIDRDQVTPNELIKTILTHDVELLFFGGIGTFIKGINEQDVGDKANDAIRINGRDIRAQVIGEGANLGVTQFGRIEYALRGGRLNTDAIDNSAGVDTSDHEVNIKILLGNIVRKGDLTVKQRDILLTEMTDDVAKLVLNDNYLQTLALSLAEAQKVQDYENYIKLMLNFEKAGFLNREVEMLPSNDEIVKRRLEEASLTRPELAILLAYSKINLYQELLASDLPDDPYLTKFLVTYFPTALQKTFSAEMMDHQLKREIISTVLTNDFLNRCNLTFIMRAKDITGMPMAEIARSYLLTKEAFQLEPVYQAIYALDNKIDAATQTEMLIMVTKFLQRNIVWLLMNVQHPIKLSERVEAVSKSALTLFSEFEDVIGHETKEYFLHTVQDLTSKHVPKDLAQKVAALNQLKSVYDVLSVSEQTKADVKTAAKLYFEIGHQFGITTLKLMLEKMPVKSHWDHQANEATLDDILGRQKLLTLKILEKDPKIKNIDQSIQSWIAQKEGNYNRLSQTLIELKGLSDINLSVITVANQQLRSLVVQE